MSELAESLLVELIAQQQQTNQLLGQLIQMQGRLIQALAEDGDDQDTEPSTYMDGSPVR